MSTRTWVCCPDCHGASAVKRLGPAGVKGVKDSRRFTCTDCGNQFRSMGETLWESYGRLK